MYAKREPYGRHRLYPANLTRPAHVFLATQKPAGNSSPLLLISCPQRLDETIDRTRSLPQQLFLANALRDQTWSWAASNTMVYANQPVSQNPTVAQCHQDKTAMALRDCCTRS